MSFRTPVLLLSTAYLPPVEYMAWMAVAESAWIEIHETYPRQTWRNRLSIITANGPLILSIPVTKPCGNHTPTGIVRISNHLPWQKQHWRAISLAYSKSAFFLFYKDYFEPLYHDRHPKQLVEWNRILLNQLLSSIGMLLPVQNTQSFEQNAERKTDLRYKISPKEKKRNKVVSALFPEYFQPFSDRLGFSPNQSIIDLLFNLGPDTLPYLKNCGKRLLHQFKEG